MDARIKSIYLIIKDNNVIACESNLKDLLSKLPDEINNIRGYDYFYRQFLNSNYFQFEFNRNYYFQKKEYIKGNSIN
ncbi:hypothetical protein ATB96_19595 [Elizabethkingia ursingii]|nr:hypothetical protein ATB96_19595 [Elizabethkingia ursingii]